MVRSKLSLPLVVSGYAILVISAYLDNVRGPILPLISRELGLSFAQNGWFLTTSQLAGIAVNLAMLVAAGRLSDRAVAIWAALAAVAAAAAAAAVHDFPSLLLFSVVTGVTITAMGIVCNLLVVEGTPPDVRGRAMAGLHTMYGIGSLGVGLIVAATTAAGIGWRWLMLGLVPLHLLMATYFRWRLPGLSTAPAAEAEAAAKESTSGLGAIDRRHYLVIGVFVLYVCGEVTTSMWLSNFLVSAHHLAPAAAAQRLSGLFAVMALSRFLCWLFVRPTHEPLLLLGSLLLPLLGFALGEAVDSWGYVLVGLVGPFFPLYMTRVSREFSQSWKKLTLWVYLAFEIGLATVNVVVGRAADRFGIAAAFTAPPLMIAATAALLCVHFALAKRPGWCDRP